MKLTKIEIHNYRLLKDVTINVDEKTTLIVGRNNTAKTSFMVFMDTILKGKALSFNDYPLTQRNSAALLLNKYLKSELNFDELIKSIPYPSMVFTVNYSQEGEEEDLGALSPFIIDVDETVQDAIIKAEYAINCTEEKLREFLTEYKNNFGEFEISEKEFSTFESNIAKLFSLKIKAINPADEKDVQEKSLSELRDLFPLFTITAERDLDETGEKSHSSLQRIIYNYFNSDKENIDPQIKSTIEELRNLVENANKDIQQKTNSLLTNLINKTIGFGYPNTDELQLGVSSKISISNEIQSSSELTYRQSGSQSELPSNYNGLGYKNLIKIQFQLAGFAEILSDYNTACIPILFIEEPEAHMHPQMQQSFIEYLETFLSNISAVNIQTFITTHSSHIANAIDFSKVRYAKKNGDKVIYKDLQVFALSNPRNIDFIRQYLTISRCDLFFADKAILIEGTSERLLLPDMIKKLEETGELKGNPLSAQYYTMIEVGGAYGHIFIPFLQFLELPSLIITDIDSIEKESKKKVVVSKGETTSNATIKHLLKQTLSKQEISIDDVKGATETQKTMHNIHIEYQTMEKGLCGRSLEESIKNANRTLYGIKETPSEDDIQFTEGSKTQFALDLIVSKTGYAVPQYIKQGLSWLSRQKIS